MICPVAIRMPLAVMKPAITGWLRKLAMKPRRNSPIASSIAPDSPASVRAAAEAAGLKAHHIPVTPGQASKDDVAAFDTAVTSATGKVLAYCRSGGRAQSLFDATRH